MKIVFAEPAWEDYLHWQSTDKQIVRRIHELIKDATHNPFTGIGKSEPLRLPSRAIGRAGSMVNIVWSIKLKTTNVARAVALSLLKT
jgi:Txe/YoeB family toxin of toxin-antitoxin system